MAYRPCVGSAIQGESTGSKGMEMSGLVLWGIPPYGGPAIKITGSDGQGDTLTREMLMRSAQGWKDLAIRRDVAAMAAPYKKGDRVKALYHAGSAGTVLGAGTVEACRERVHGGWKVTVDCGTAGVRAYNVSSNGHSDYLLPAD